MSKFLQNDRKKDNKFQKAFTLVELLVVISIIALLLAILMPSLQKAREQAQSVVCGSNLKHWGIMLNLYAAENDGYFHLGRQDLKGNPNVIDPDHIWLNAYREYFGEKDDIRMCPTAKKIVMNPNHQYAPPDPLSTNIGGARIAWRNYYLNNQNDIEITEGSYGLNGFCTSGQDNSGAAAWTKGRYWIKVSNVTSPDKVPFVLDSAYWKTYPAGYEGPDMNYAMNLEDDWSWKIGASNIKGLFYKNYMACHAIDRHRGRINAVFMDMSSRPTGLKELWALKWNKEYTNPAEKFGRKWTWGEWLNKVSR